MSSPRPVLITSVACGCLSVQHEKEKKNGNFFQRKPDEPLCGALPETDPWCPSCGTEVEMITAFEVARVAAVSSSTIYLQAEGGEIHSKVTAESVLLICLKSLSENATLDSATKCLD